MFRVTITKGFSAAHVLKEIGGKCEELHGHNFKVEVTVSSGNLNNENILIDFRVLKAWTAEILEGLDHKYLNDLPQFRGVNPSSEVVAKHIYDRLSAKTRPLKIKVDKVVVWESDNARVTYSGART
ncbi:MAG TPA: 6-carboxytetrahydropterin synthase QueD [Syntrophales bacterium]|nr:6-carboxytetrahydropterin synthase QueD [Syntrophales bacterium]HOX95362.1 6-carboxytetrahydropterin synthase QueD [Syntrophales bacterium]HPI56914.1 6-carboxytetrahydropterin synthase QueD [Syntrophales bacterium]HPN23500.1 6-carboxytetrahydropterin synthase QueD [Syntrophales bacterium]HQM27975.1 6-carboxytetrahydropterin synthase QueD [Syntrophales bacterium]